MQTSYPNGKITLIADGQATIQYHDGVMVVSVSKLPAGAKVGDRVTVFTETTVNEVRFWPPE